MQFALTKSMGGQKDAWRGLKRAQGDKLLSQGEVSPDCRDNEGKTPLISAAEGGNAALVAVLIRQAADVNALDSDGEAGLTKAAFGGHIAVAKMLIENGADLEMQNNDGSTALEIAKMRKQDDLAALLSGRSADSMSGVEEEISTDPDDDGPPETSQAPEPGTSAQTEIGNESAEALMERITGKSIGTVTGATPYQMFKKGMFNGLYGSTVDQVANNIKGIIIATIFQAYLIIGYYLLAVYFDNDESLAFSKNPYKETSINDLAKRDDIPFSKQKLTDCIKAAAVDMELHKNGDVDERFDHLNYEHLLQLGRLKKQDQRLSIARVANRDKLTSNELKKFIDNMLGKRTSQDKQIGRTLIRQLREFVRLASDEDVRAFLSDKERSAVLDHTETAQLLDFSGKFRQTVSDSQEMLKQLECNLRDNFMEKQKEKLPEDTQDTPDLDT
jgi:ankyrin repeat protein